MNFSKITIEKMQNQGNFHNDWPNEKGGIYQFEMSLSVI